MNSLSSPKVSSVDADHSEQRALSVAKWMNLVMGVLGVGAALLSNSNALLLDGLFSGVGFMAAVFAARVARSARRSPDAMRPFGYEIDEAVYVMFRSLVLIGIILLACLSAAMKIYRYIDGEVPPEIELNWIMYYVLLMMLICFGLAAFHQAMWKRTGKRSDVLRSERQGAVIDGALSLGAGVGFLAISALKGTSLDFLVPVSDSVVVLGLSLCMIRQPIGMFRGAMAEVVGEPDSPETRDLLFAAARDSIAGSSFTVLDAAVTKTGRARFAVFYVRADQAVSAAEIDEVQSQIRNAAQSAWTSSSLRLECLFSSDAPLQSSR